MTISSDVDAEPMKKFPDKEKSELADIKQLLAYLTDHLKDQEKNGKVEDEWKAVAMVLDRLFFWITLVMSIILVPLFLVQNDPDH